MVSRGRGVATLGEGHQKVKMSSYEINKFGVI